VGSLDARRHAPDLAVAASRNSMLKPAGGHGKAVPGSGLPAPNGGIGEQGGLAGKGRSPAQMHHCAAAADGPWA